MCLNLKEVKREILFSSAILLKLKPFNKLSIIFFHTSKGNLMWQIIVLVVSDKVDLQPLQIYQSVIMFNTTFYKKKAFRVLLLKW